MKELASKASWAVALVTAPIRRNQPTTLIICCLAQFVVVVALASTARQSFRNETTLGRDNDALRQRLFGEQNQRHALERRIDELLEAKP